MDMSKKKKVVVIGGGTGTFGVLRGLKRYTDTIDLSAIVTMADSGGSTGRLRDEFGYLPVGDVRMALVALADEALADDRRLRELFLYRFEKGGKDLAGHNFGNLLLVALTDILGSEIEAIRFAERLLRTHGHVHPVTTDHVTLVAAYDDGMVVRGETHIDEPEASRLDRRIVELSCEPLGTMSDEAFAAIRTADLIILGPGDLYTSVLAVCVVGGVSEALHTTKAKIMHIGNLMTKRGQTAGMSLEDHVREIERYIARTVDVILANSEALPRDLISRYHNEGEQPVLSDGSRTVVHADLVSFDVTTHATSDALRRSLIRHDAYKLAEVIIKCI